MIFRISTLLFIFQLLINTSYSQTLDWMKNLGTLADENADKIVIGPDSTFYISGNFYGSITFDETASGSPITLTSLGMADIFLARYSQAGILLWVKQLANSEVNTTEVMRVDNYGNVIIGSRFFSSYPNPANEKINLNFNRNYSGLLKIYSITGQLLKEENINAEILAVDVSSFQAGLYFYAVSDEQNYTITGKFIKN